MVLEVVSGDFGRVHGEGLGRREGGEGVREGRERREGVVELEETTDER